MRKARGYVWFFLALLLITAGCGGGGGGGGGSSGDGTIKLAWDANTEPELAGYNVYYGTSQGLYLNMVNAGLGTPGSAGEVTYTLGGLTKGQVYYIAVTAYDQTGLESALSNEVSGPAG